MDTGRQGDGVTGRTQNSEPRTQNSLNSQPSVPDLGRVARAAVIVAAGRGTRMGEDKVWLPLGAHPVVAYSLKAFSACPSIGRLVMVVGREQLERARELADSLGLALTVCEGGERRQDSVTRGLEAAGEADLVAIHDGARPFVTPSVIEACYQAAEESGAAVAAVPVRDTVKRATEDGWVSETVDRRSLWVVQTPQTFGMELLRHAYRQLVGEVTDDAAAVEALGYPVKIVPGDPANFKLTTPEDLELARALVAHRENRGRRS